VDVERFAAELPGLFEDYPRSPVPKGRRFDDVIDGIPNLATENVLALLNLAASLLGPGESYVEVGSFYGASLIGAMRGNDGDFVAIDRFSFDVAEVRGRKLPHASREGLEQSLARFGAEHAAILEGDAFELIEGGALGRRSVGVYYWDGPHDYRSQLRGMRAIEPWLAPEALILVDDYDWGGVAWATRDYVAGDARAELLVEIAGEKAGQSWWWDGVVAVARRA
jgi:predicted O-methyltransferase YrrM